MKFSVICALIRFIAFAISLGTVNGYILGRLITIKDDGDLEPPQQEPSFENEPSKLQFASFLNDQPSQTNYYPFNIETIPLKPTTGRSKKAGPSQFGGYKKSMGLLKKYSGTGSRNCFFTPIQCMIQHDMSKYKKLVDSNIQIGRISRR